ncbi:MAG: aspartate kinase [Chitinophagaceae bacterium]
MKVFKFGGASVNGIERIVKVGEILKSFSGEKLLVVISAMGKTTNALEKVVDAYFAGKKDESIELFTAIKNQHLQTAKQLLLTQWQGCEKRLVDFFTEVEWLLHDKPQRDYDYYYDQVVSIGELLSTTIISFYLKEISVANEWVDVRDIIRTDDNFRDANIDWEFTQSKVQTGILPLFNHCNIVLTQGFIGATDENESTTLGREGSDYTAAVFANMLNAESQTIWKDVESVMNADPKQFSDAQPIKELNYNEVIEMAYYGAQVIHPKTIKPLQNKSIPLYVKCFLNPSLPGTVIHNKPLQHLPAIIVIKEKQVMLKLISKDFSFVGEQHVAKLYSAMGKLKIKPNLTQNAAISFILVLDDRSEKIEKLAFEVAEIFDVQIRKQLTLLTVRHYQETIVQQLTSNKNIILRQQTPETIQMLLSD